MILKGHICIKDEALLAELETLKYSFDHQQRRILIPKDVMKNKFKVKSPNMADALIMAVSLIGEIKDKQDSCYVPRRVNPPDDNLFAMAGVM